MRIVVVVAASLLAPGALLAQEPAAAPACCADESAPLPPLPDDATEKERWLRRIHDEADRDSANIFLSARTVDGWRKRLAQLPPQAPLAQRFGLRWSLAQGCMRIGQLDEAIDLLEQCVALCEANPVAAKSWLPEVLLRLASAHFRVAEKQNCIANHNAESCIFPLSGRAVHQDPRGAEAACAVLDRLLALPESDLRLEALWLQNIAHMARGTWPDGVPEAARLPARCFTSEQQLPRFVDRAEELGLARRGHAGSLVIDDFTGDGRLDVLTGSFDTGKSLRLCRNEGDGRFADVTEAAGLARQLGAINLVQADVDGDGRLDVLVLRGGGFLAGAQFPNSLLRQDRPGHFVDVTKEAGIEIAAPTRAAAFGDVDRDGDLDLFIGYETERGEGGTLRFPSKLFLNDGAGRFADVTEKSGIVNAERCVAALFGDVDGDFLPDLFLTNWLAGNKLFLNRGGGVFADVTAERGLGAPVTNGPACLFDRDNDGDLDLFVGYSHHDRQVRSVAGFVLDGRIEYDTQRLFENDGKGSFRDLTEASGLRRVALAIGVNAGDVDDDGRPDLYLATGGHDFAALFPNVLLMNSEIDGDRFRDATFSAGVGHLQKSNGVAFADLDDDGDLEIAVQIGGYYQDDAFGDVLFENPGSGNHWLAIDLRGEKDHRFGVGARLRARVAGPDGERDVCTIVGSGGSLGSNPLRAHLGLGRAERVVYLEVTWPIGGVQRVESVPLDALIVVRQGADRCERIERTAQRLGGGPR